MLGNREQGMQLMDQAVLFRGSHSSDRLELELVRRNIPYVKYGGLKFLEAAHVKDLLAILKWAENPKNEVAAFRVLKLMPGFGPSFAARCFEHVALNDYSLGALCTFAPPSAATGDWAGFCETHGEPVVGDTRRHRVAGPGEPRAPLVPAAPGTHV